MKYSETQWIAKRERGLIRYLLVDGVLLTGGPFAVVMQAIGYFLLTEAGTSFGEYFSMPRTWMTFFFHGTLFGTIMGFIKWRRNEKAFTAGTVVN